MCSIHSYVSLMTAYFCASKTPVIDILGIYIFLCRMNILVLLLGKRVKKTGITIPECTYNIAEMQDLLSGLLQFFNNHSVILKLLYF